MIHYLPEIYLVLLGFAVFMYAILDGYDLGVGMLLPMDNEPQRDRMIASIGPFWDANETWLVLAVGILLIAFPSAHSLILTELYLPTVFMLIGLILRGVAFDFRAKARADHKDRWDLAFKLGSGLTALTQGYMIGRYVLGFTDTLPAYGFALLSSICVMFAYIYIGGAWLILKTEGSLQLRAVRWARSAGWFMLLGIIAISVVNPLVNSMVAERWFQVPQVFYLMPIPLAVFAVIFLVERYLYQIDSANHSGNIWPFVGVASIFALSFIGLGYSFFPDVVPGKLSAREAASATETLLITGIGVSVVMPMILAYTILVYRIFKGKASDLSYK